MKARASTARHRRRRRRERGRRRRRGGWTSRRKAVDPIRHFSEGGGVGSPRRGGMTEHVVVSIGKEGG
jgi:hypothetical protein